MVSTPSAPPAPDPVATAQAQAGMNISTGTANQMINMVDQVTPDGSLTYQQTGTNSYRDPATRTTYEVPKFTATQTLSPEQQKLKDLTTSTNLNLGQIGVDQSAKVGELLSKPVNINNAETEARLMQLGSARLDPKFAQQEEGLRSRLINSGIREGSAAWNSEMGNFQQGKNDAYNQLLLTGRGQAVQEALTERNQPLNEISALLSGSQVSQPNFTNTPQTQVAGVDYTGLVKDQYAGQMAQWQNKVNSQNAMMGGLFGLAGSGATAAIKYSDRRLKTDIEKVGKLENGLGIYSYRYKGSDKPEIGLMAQEVEKKNPDAVMTVNGFKAVNYKTAMEG